MRTCTKNRRYTHERVLFNSQNKHLFFKNVQKCYAKRNFNLLMTSIYIYWNFNLNITNCTLGESWTLQEGVARDSVQNTHWYNVMCKTPISSKSTEKILILISTKIALIHKKQQQHTFIRPNRLNLQNCAKHNFEFQLYTTQNKFRSNPFSNMN